MKSDRPVLSDLAFFGLLLAALISTAGGHVVGGDEETMFRVTQNLLAGRGLAVGREMITIPAQDASLFLPDTPEPFWTTSAVPGRGGYTYSKYGIGQSLAAVPLYLLGGIGGGLLTPENHSQPEGWAARLAVSMLNPLALAGCGWLLVRFGRALGYRTSTSRWIALAAIFTSMAWPYVKTFYPQPGVMFLVLGAVYMAYRWRGTLDQHWLWGLSLACGAAILFRLSTIIILPAIVLYLTLAAPAHRRWDWILPLAVGVAAALGVTAGYNWLRFGSIFTTGYDEIAWTTPAILGLYGLLVGPGKGILLYAPMLILGVAAWDLFARQHRAEFWLFTGLWLSYLAFYAPYNFWTGGFNWGPRFLLPVLPLAFLPLGVLLEDRNTRLARVLFATFFIIGLIVQIPAILVDHSRYLFQSFAGADISQAYGQTILSVEHSPIVRQWPVALDLLKAYSQTETWQQATLSLQAIADHAPDVPNGQALLQSEFLRRNTLDFWWLHIVLLCQLKG
ncbi:MAG: hypothetical protein KKD28_08130 [Chloroflexi bacterium]|nr:hypothetical protein [Chloroflexota bacterium]MBU1661427.1 hypothetical protein [Chloroflexota bacterium]